MNIIMLRKYGFDPKLIVKMMLVNHLTEPDLDDMNLSELKELAWECLNSTL